MNGSIPHRKRVGPKIAAPVTAEIYREWSASGHARGVNDRHFRNLYEGTDWHGHPSGWGLLNEHPNGAGVCAACHVPALPAGDPARFDLRWASGVAAQGVHCDFCHKVAGLGDGPIGLSHGVLNFELRRPTSGQLFFGPLDDVDRGEDAYTPLLPRQPLLRLLPRRRRLRRAGLHHLFGMARQPCPPAGFAVPELPHAADGDAHQPGLRPRRAAARPGHARQPPLLRRRSRNDAAPLPAPVGPPNPHGGGATGRGVPGRGGRGPPCPHRVHRPAAAARRGGGGRGRSGGRGAGGRACPHRLVPSWPASRGGCSPSS